MKMKIQLTKGVHVIIDRDTTMEIADTVDHITIMLDHAGIARMGAACKYNNTGCVPHWIPTNDYELLGDAVPGEELLKEEYGDGDEFVSIHQGELYLLVDAYRRCKGL